MRLSEWRQTQRGQKVMTNKQAAVFDSALRGVGAGKDPIAHVLWGDDWQVRYQIMAATDAGLAVCNVRVNIPQEGPRAVAKLVRWHKVAVGDLSVEAHHGHRYVTAQVENQVLQGMDDDANLITAWIGHLYARIDGRAMPDAVSGLLPAGSEKA